MQTRISPLAVVAITAITVLGCVAAQKNEAARGRILPAHQMHDARASHTATLLRDGRVLITGGMVENGVFLDTAELFDPKTSTFETLPKMSERRVGHTATLLSDGRVVIIGGNSDRELVNGQWQGVLANTIEVFDPRTRKFSCAGELLTPRTSHAAVALKDDRIVILGGYAQHGPIGSVEFFAPHTGKTTDGGALASPRGASGAVLFKNGEILLAGGSKEEWSLNPTIEIYDPAKKTSKVVGQLQTPRYKHAMVLLDDGRVLIAGGSNTSDWTGQYASAEVFDVKTGSSKEVSSMAQQRFKIRNAAVLLPDGNVLIAGGKAQAERFDPLKGAFSLVEGDMGGPHYFSTATLLSDGRVLVAGGYGNGGRGRGPMSTRDSWLYVPWPQAP